MGRAPVYRVRVSAVWAGLVWSAETAHRDPEVARQRARAAVLRAIIRTAPDLPEVE